MNNLKVLITAIGGASIGEQLLKVVRLSNLNFTVYGADTTSTCAHRKEVQKFFILPLASAPDYIDVLEQICADNKIEVLLPGSEPELKIISTHRNRLLGQKIFLPINPDRVIHDFLDKEKTNLILNSLGVSIPFACTIASIDQVSNLVDFPYVLKPKSGSSGSANTFIVQDAEELHIFSKYLLLQYSAFQVQQYVGVPEEEYTVGVLMDMQGEIINSIVIRRHILNGLGMKMKVKNRTTNKELGSHLVISSGISQGEVLSRFHLNESCEEIALLIKACSAINIQCRLVNGKPCIFEINPRFSGTSSLRALIGYNEVEILVRGELLKEPFRKYFQYKTGTILRGLSEYYFS